MGDPLVGPILYFASGSICTLIAVGIVGGAGYLIYRKKNQDSNHPVGNIPKHSEPVSSSHEAEPTIEAPTIAPDPMEEDAPPTDVPLDAENSEALNPISEELLTEAENNLPEKENQSKSGYEIKGKESKSPQPFS